MLGSAAEHWQLASEATPHECHIIIMRREMDDSAAHACAQHEAADDDDGHHSRRAGACVECSGRAVVEAAMEQPDYATAGASVNKKHQWRRVKKRPPPRLVSARQQSCHLLY